MIAVTRLDGSRFGVNDDQIERIDETPTTVVTLVNGNRYLVRETLDEIVEAIVAFRAAALGASAGAEHRGLPDTARPSRPHLTVFSGVQHADERPQQGEVT